MVRPVSLALTDRRLHLLLCPHREADFRLGVQEIRYRLAYALLRHGSRLPDHLRVLALRRPRIGSSQNDFDIVPILRPPPLNLENNQVSVVLDVQVLAEDDAGVHAVDFLSLIHI